MGNNTNKNNFNNNNNNNNKKQPRDIPPDQLKTLLNSPIVHNFILEADYALYQYLVDILLPKVLKPIPNTLTQWIRTFSKNLENWMNTALVNVPEDLKNIKVINHQNTKVYNGLPRHDLPRFSTYHSGRFGSNF